MSLFFLHGK